jgi:hypothetical protein
MIIEHGAEDYGTRAWCMLELILIAVEGVAGGSLECLLLRFSQHGLPAREGEAAQKAPATLRHVVGGHRSFGPAAHQDDPQGARLSEGTNLSADLDGDGTDEHY